MFTTFQKKHNYLICIDSDGCVMDTMNVKHINCFAPCTISSWGLEQWESEVLALWKEVNLYTMTRAINRFKGLAMVLDRVNDSFCQIEELDVLKNWAYTSKELSNKGLEKAIAEHDSAILKKTLAWSKEINKRIDAIPLEEKLPFKEAIPAIKKIRQVADIAVVSSANQQAVFGEWTMHNLIQYTDIILTQESGNKNFCIQELMKKGYDAESVIMLGDAPGDLDSAKKNHILFYPILVNHENESWISFIEEGLQRFLDKTYVGSYEAEKAKQFQDNLLRNN